MDSSTTVGLLHPGEMGAAVAAALNGAGHRVVWASEGRGPESARRAADAGLEDVGTLAAVCEAAELVLSILPPAAALATAEQVTAFAGTWVEANAVAPATAERVARAIGHAGGRCVDGSIVGGPPTERGDARLYLSGDGAAEVAALFDRTAVDARVCGARIGDASALKMAYAGQTKGSAALLLAARELAVRTGVLETLLAEWQLSHPELLDRWRAADAAATSKGWRWSGEMREIAAAMRAAGLPPGFHEAAAEIYDAEPADHADHAGGGAPGPGPTPAGDRHVETTLIAAGRPPAVPDGPLNAPIAPASALHPGAVGYARGDNPAWAPLEAALGELEGGEAVVFASGMAAASAVYELFGDGARVVAPRISYQHVRSTLQRLAGAGRIELELVDVTDTDATLAAASGADALWLESPTNPLLGIADLPALCAHGRESPALTVVDSTLATPLGQRPLALGADVVVHSATKALGGHSDLLLGVAVVRDPELARRLRDARGRSGATPGALEVFLCLRGLRTLHLRQQRATDNAAVLAARLAAYPDVAEVVWPGAADHPHADRVAAFMDGPGSMLTFSPAGGAERADALLDALTLLTHATSLGGVETTLERRARYPDEQELIPDSLLRVSVGCEHADDLWSDLAQALEATRR